MYYKNIEEELFERINDITSTKGITSLDQLAKDKGYFLVRVSDFEARLVKDGANMDIVARIVSGQYVLLVEPRSSMAELVPSSTSTLPGIPSGNPVGFNIWRSCRTQDKANPSICTRTMPSIIGSVLRNYYHVEDRELLLEMERKLLPFGSPDFGAVEYGFPDRPYDSWEWATPSYVCYAPGELEAIVEVCHEILQEADTVEKLRKYDMARFKEQLRKKAADIPATSDIALFGRHLSGSGLREYEAAIRIGNPVRIA